LNVIALNGDDAPESVAHIVVQQNFAVGVCVEETSRFSREYQIGSGNSNSGNERGGDAYRQRSRRSQRRPSSPRARKKP
jgi:hypothetical protein